MSTALHVFLEAEPFLKCDVVDIAADPPAYHHLGQVIYLPLFLRDGLLHGSPKCGLDLLEKFLPQRLHWAGEQVRVAGGR